VFRKNKTHQERTKYLLTKKNTKYKRGKNTGKIGKIRIQNRNQEERALLGRQKQGEHQLYRRGDQKGRNLKIAGDEKRGEGDQVVIRKGKKSKLLDPAH